VRLSFGVRAFYGFSKFFPPLVKALLFLFHIQPGVPAGIFSETRGREPALSYLKSLLQTFLVLFLPSVS
jgi:hypothetical protein